MSAKLEKIDWIFCDFRWYRKLTKARWERWWVDVIYDDVWHRVKEWSDITGEKPTAICRGTPIKEDWTKK